MAYILVVMYSRFLYTSFTIPPTVERPTRKEKAMVWCESPVAKYMKQNNTIYVYFTGEVAKKMEELEGQLYEIQKRGCRYYRISCIKIYKMALGFPVTVPWLNSDRSRKNFKYSRTYTRNIVSYRNSISRDASTTDTSTKNIKRTPARNTSARDAPNKWHK